MLAVREREHGAIACAVSSQQCSPSVRGSNNRQTPDELKAKCDSPLADVTQVMAKKEFSYPLIIVLIV